MKFKSMPLPQAVPVGITRRDLLAGAVASALLAACGAKEAGDGATNTTGPAAGAAVPMSLPRRSVTHSKGTTEVPARATRVVTLSEALDGHISSVGLLAVGAIDEVEDWLAPYRDLLDKRLDLGAIASVSSEAEPNYEAIIRLRPELILVETSSEEFYPKLAAIAPTVVISRPNNAAWKSAFDQTVTAVGYDAEATVVRERFAKALREVGGKAGGLEISFIRSNGDGNFTLDGTDRFGGSVGAEAGFKVTDVPADVLDSFEISGERLDIVTGGLIVLPGRRQDIETVASFEKNPLWAKLPAVRAGRVVALPNPVYNGGTYVAAELLLAAIGRAV